MKKILTILLIITYSQAFGQVMTSVATGEYSHHYLKSDGTIWYTQLVTFNSAYAQQQITSLDSIVDLDGGQYTSIFLRKNGKVFSATGNSNNSTAYALDNLGNAFTADKVYAMWRMGVAIKSGQVYYWSLAQNTPEDMLQQFGSLTTPVTTPRLLIQPTGKTITKCVFGAGLSPYGNSFLWGLASDGTLWQWDATHTTPFQVIGKTGYSNVWTGTVIDIVANFDARMVITSTNQVWTWGYNSGNYGGHFDYQNVDMDNIAGNLTTAGIQFPIKQIVASYLTIQLIDATNSRYGMGTNQTGNLGSGYMWPSFRTNKAGSTPTPWAYNYQPYDGLQATWLKMPGQWLQLRDNSSFVFYTYGQDMGGNWYAWGRGKDQSTLSGYTSQAADQSSYPDWMTIPAPRLVYPFTQTWVVDGAVDTTAARKPWASAGPNQYLHGVTATQLIGSGSHQNQPTAAGVTITTTNNWTKTSGPNTPSISSATATSPTLTGLINGTYIYRNTVTNSNAATDFQEVTLNISDTHKWYVANNGNDANDGATPATAWQTIAKVNTATLAAGDSVLFNRGDVFYGMLKIGYSGTASLPIVLSSYGTGADAVISGLSTVTGWTLSTTGIYVANLNASSRLNNVLVNGFQEPIGRFPNFNSTDGGYLTYTAAGGSSTAGGTGTITFASTPATNWLGAEMRLKMKNWVINTVPITSVTGALYSYTQPAVSAYPGSPGFGAFIQNDVRTLDQLGEWFYDTTAKKIYMYFGAASPSSYTVQASTVDTLLYSYIKNYITINHLTFTGANKDAIVQFGGDNLVVKNSNIVSNGRTAINTTITTNVLIDSCVIKNNLGSAVFFRNTGITSPGGVISNCQVDSTEKYEGMGISGDGSNRNPIGVFSGSASGAGIVNMIIRNDSITNSGYLGIEWAGSNFLIENNYINKYCLIKDDGGGIYTFNSLGTNPTTYSNRLVQRNVILNGIGCYFGTGGTSGKARPIYNDNNTNNVTYYKNYAAYASNAGAYNNTTKGITYDNNIFYKCGFGFSFNRYPGNDTLKSITLNHNYFLPLSISNVSDNDINNPTAGKTIDQVISRAFTMDSSVYYTPSGTALLDSFFQARTYDGVTITSSNKNINYFKSMGMETHSQVIDSASVLFDYNPNYAPKVITLIGSYSFENIIYAGTYSIPSKKAVLLFKTLGPIVSKGTLYLRNLKIIK